MIALALKRQSQQQAQQHAIKLEQQAQRHAKQMQAERASRDKAMSQLMAKVKIREAGPSFLNAGKKPVPLKTQPFPSPPISRINPSGYLNHKAATPKKSNGSTPQRTPSGQTKPAVTPKTNSPKTSPHKMISANMPESFASTRDALYAHIKVIWNLLEQKTVPSLKMALGTCPKNLEEFCRCLQTRNRYLQTGAKCHLYPSPPPHPNTLLEFTSHFSSADEIEQIANDAGTASLIPVRDVVTLKGIQCGGKKVGKGLVNLEEFFVSYTQAILARLGMRVWAPDLDDLPDSLNNEACRQAALKSFRQAAIGGAYSYMNVNKKYATDLTLLIPAYNHFVHHLQKQQYNREKNQTGRFRMDEERKLRDSRLKFALAQGLLKRYQKVISDVNCHSDNEYSSQRQGYLIKTLKFCSPNATKFFCRLDAAIVTSDELDGKRVQRRRRIVPPTTQPSLFTKPPKGQPLDFYNPDWFNKLLPQQRIDIADTREVAFLPDASQSLMGKKLASEKLSNKKFTATFFDQLSKPYNLTHEIEVNVDDDDSTNDEDDASFNGEEIDLAHSSGDNDEEYEEEEEDFGFVDNSMATSEPEQVEQEDENVDNNKEEELAREARCNAMMIDT
ncbi:hypothetical protein KEM48_010214 [Puccinia striiformis f. sp. tritici PST-130]|nr:hypothetical protein KEM48_010214 [Puccinia striiformis f. sp. tritici PST-130]